MKRNLIIILIIAVAGILALAQDDGRSTASVAGGESGTIPRKYKVDQSPYTIGERFLYEGKYKKFGLAFTVADLEFEVSRAADGENVFIKSRARSRGTLVKLLSFSFLQKIDSSVDEKNLRIDKTVKHDKQKKRIRDSEADFDYGDNKVTYVETDPNEPSRPPRRVASTIDSETQDVVTAVYMLRRMPFKVGRKFLFNVSDSGLVYQIPVRVVGRERRKTVLGKIWCWKVEPDIFGEGKFIEQKGKFTIWISDDDRRIPVRAVVDSRLGNITFKLKRGGSVSKR